MPATAKAVIAEARKYLNVVEKPANSNRTQFGKWFGADGNAWCAMFVSYVLAHAGAPEILKGAQTAKGSAQVSKIKAHLKKRGAKQIKPADAMPGDVVIFDFPGGYETDHVGFIRNKTAAGKKVIQTIEGNTSPPNGTGSQANGGGVYARTRSFSVVESIWRPNYTPETPAATAPAAAVPAAAVPVVETPAPVVSTPPKAVQPVKLASLAKGSTGAAVKKLQAALKITADGIYGAQTEAAVKAFQLKKGIVITGVADEATQKRLYK